MALSLPSLSGANKKKRSQIMALDLGNRTTKAALFERRGEIIALTRFALLDAPIFEKKISPELLGEHMKAASEALGGATKHVAVAVGLEDAVVRQVELPQIPVDEMRRILKINHKTYLQQELTNHVFDCSIMPLRGGTPAEKGVGGVPKLKVVAAAAKQQLANDFMQAAQLAGLTAVSMVPGLIGPINAFEQANPKIFAEEVIALVDIGFKHTSVCILDRGDLAMNRIVNIGGDKITAGLAEALSVSYAEAEGIKVGMAPEVEGPLQLQVIPLGREIRASLDFFEHQEDRVVGHIFVSGATARSEMVLQMLHSELMLECKTWSPTGFLQLALPGQQAVEIDHIGSQLTVAIGAAIAAL